MEKSLLGESKKSLSPVQNMAQSFVKRFKADVSMVVDRGLLKDTLRTFHVMSLDE